MWSQPALMELYRHMEWADATVWKVTPLSGQPDARLRELLVHIHVVQRAFFSAWTSRPVTDAFKRAEEFETLGAVRSWAQPLYREMAAFVQGLTEERLAAPMNLPWAQMIADHLGMTPHVTTLADTCFQVTSHTTYHRGQVNTRLREIGAEPPLVDYIAWAWFGKPVAEWTT
jgi:uncharacterized damage-inducible protein DinB